MQTDSARMSAYTNRNNHNNGIIGADNIQTDNSQPTKLAAIASRVCPIIYVHYCIHPVEAACPLEHTPLSQTYQNVRHVKHFHECNYVNTCMQKLLFFACPLGSLVC